MTVIQDALDIWKPHAILREGRKTTVYRDSLGKLTVGIGHLVMPEDRLNAGDRISDIQIDIFFNQDTQRALDTSLKQWQEIGIKTAAFLAALISVNFQLGDFAVKFKNSYSLLKAHEFDKVIENLKSSLWMKQTPVRVEDFIKALHDISH